MIEQNPPGAGQGQPRQSNEHVPVAATAGPTPGWAHPQKTRGLFSTIVAAFVTVVFVFVFAMSILMNLYLGAVVAAQSQGDFVKTTTRKGEESQVIAVYTVAGVIDGAAATRFRRFCRLVLGDANVKAVVLRVSSPGGGVGASDEINSLVKTLKNGGKKVVVSMGSVAASGGYYISAPADEIIAEPTTITGSIGVISSWVVLDKTLDKIGAEMMVVRSSHARGWKDGISSFHKPQPRHRKHMQQILDAMQTRFEDVVKDGRGEKLPQAARDGKMKEISEELTVNQAGEKVTVTQEPYPPFNGNIFLADEARKLGLVDKIGYRGMAIDRAKALASLSNPTVIRYEVHRGIFQQMMGASSREPRGLTIDRATLDEFQTPRIMMLWKPE
jgi:protease-4